MSDKHDYEVALKWNEGRRGTLSSPDLDTDIEVVTPPEFPGGEPGIWSPEHLFVASVSSCLMTTFAAIAENSNLAFTEFSVTARGRLEKAEGRYMISEITLMPKIVIEEEKFRDKAGRILVKAEKGCLISNSIRSSVKLEPEIMVTETA